MNGKAKGGAPEGNENALKTGRRSAKRPPRGSKLRRDYEYAGTLATNRARLVEAELQAKNGGRPLTVAQDNQVRQIWLAEAADRVAAMLLGNGKNFKGTPLTLAEQNEQRAIQRQSQRDIEIALNKLGIGLATTGNASPATDWAAMLAAERPTATPGAFSDASAAETPQIPAPTPNASHAGNGKATAEASP